MEWCGATRHRSARITTTVPVSSHENGSKVNMLEMLCNHCDTSHRTERKSSVTVNVENTESQEQDSGDSGRGLVRRTSNSGFCCDRGRKPKKCEVDEKEGEACLRQCHMDECPQKDETATARTTIEIRCGDHRTMASGMQKQDQEVGAHDQDHQQRPVRYRAVDRSYPNDDWDRKEESGKRNGLAIDEFCCRKKRLNGSMLLLTLFCLLASTTNLWDISRLLGPGSMLVAAAGDQRSAGQIDKDNGSK